MVKLKSNLNRLFQGGVEIAFATKHFVKYLLLLIAFSGTAYAQYNSVQSRFITSPGPFSQTCSIADSDAGCMPNTDGVVHMRFDLDNVRIDDNRTPTDSDDDRVVFKIEVRKISPQSGSALPYSVGGLGIDYNPALFGENLADSSDVSEQCTYIRGDAFTGTASYKLTAKDTSPGLLSLFEVANDFTDSNATANSFSEINDDDWQDFIEMRCLINFDADGNGSIDAGEGGLSAEAGIALSRRLWAENQVWIASDGESDALNRTVFGFADNDLRGFRVDGKTWVQDYARYDDGKGVRVQFSKGIKTPLEAKHFVLDDNNAAVNIQTRHEAGSAYADIIFDTAISSGILRLSSTSNRIVLDESDEALADGSFVAALEYDADAPRAMKMVMTGDQYDGTVNRSTWAIRFNKPLNRNFIALDGSDLCITEMKGVCAADDAVSMDTVSIESVSLSESATTLTVVINEGNGQMGGMRSIEFRRNAVLGADLRVAEDYQTALRDKIELTDRVGPTITVTTATLVRSSTLPLGYDISFTVTANEIVGDLADPQSYLLAGIKTDDTIVAYSDISGTAETSADGAVTLSYQYEVNGENIEALQDIGGFTLLRATATALLDEADKEPIRVDDSNVESYEEYEAGSVVLGDARIDLRAPSVAVRADTDSPRLSLSKVGDAMPDMSDPLRYSGTFVVTADEAVADIASASSYVLLHKNNLDSMLNEIEATITFSDVSDQKATVHFETDFERITDVRETAGFTLARGSATSLLDMDFNAPVREGDGSDIASGDPIDSTVVVERGTSSLPISVEAVSLRRDIDPSANVRIYRYDAVPDSDDGNRYTVRFEVRSEISIPDIAEAASYSVIAKPIDGNNQSTPTISEVMLVEALVNDTFDTTTLTYSILMDDIDATRQTAGFALVRANDSLQDMYSNEPTNSDGNIINNGDEIDARDAAFAERDTVVPQLAISVLQERLNSDGYQIEFDVDLGADHPADIRNVRSPGSYQLLRKLSDGRYVALETEPSDPTIRSGRNLYTQIRLSEAEARETVALGLGRRGEGDFLDLANNAPITVGLDNVPVASGAPLDVSVGAEAKPNEPHPSVTVEAQGMARVNESNPLVYEGSFVLTANAPIENRLLRAANYPNDIPSLTDTGSYWLQRILVGDDDDPTTQTAQLMITNVGVTNNTSHATSATLSFMTTFDSLDEVMQTKGFTLVRRDNLLDYASNYPVDPVDTDREIMRGDRLDARDAAVALRDMTAPSIGVTRSGDLSIEASGYTMTFEVSVPDDVPSGIGSDARTITSYRLLRKLNDGNYAVVSGVLPRSVAQSSAITVGYVNVPLLSPPDALLTEGFTLGRSVGSFLDINSNDPVVEIEIDGTPQTVVVTVTPPLPLDAKASALFAMDRVNPKMTVVAGTASKIADDRYSGSFNVWSGADATLDGATDEEAIDGIESSASYVLLRVPSGTNNPVALSDAVITVVADLNSYRSATVSFKVEDAQAAVGDKFTLGRAARLTDLSGNALIAHDATDASGAIGDGDPIDSRPAAEVDVPPDVVTNPQITVTALPSGNGVATADPNNPLRYTGSFSVTADRAVTGIGNADSYKLLRIARDGTHEETKASSTTIAVTLGRTTADAVGEETTMTFAVTLDAAMVAQTRGFTLGRKANLQDGETLPLFDAARADRLDASASAVAEIEITAQITVLATTDAAGIGAQPDEADGDRYSMTFVVRSSIAIEDIGNENSYILLHLPTDGDTAIADLSPYIETSSVDANPSGREATLRYTVRFTDTATQTQKTAGFTLGRADGALLGGESVIDASEAAKARRDTTPPVISVQIDSNRVSAAGYDIGFTLSSDNNERVRGLASAGNYVLLRQLLNNLNTYRITSPTAVITFTETLPQSPIASVSLASRARLTVADARATAAFTIGYGGATPLRDLANNDAVSAGNAALTVNQPYDSNVLAARDTTAPLLSVPRYEASLVESALDEVPAGNYYDIVFDIKAQQFVGGLTDADDVRGLATASSYRLIRRKSDGEVVVDADTVEITLQSPSLVTLSYRRVFLTLAQLRETTSFILASALADADDPYDCKLCDFASNAPIGIGAGEVLDSNAIAALDNIGELIQVIALSDAEPSEFSPNRYSGSFRVEADNPVTDIADVASYSLLRVPLNNGNAGNAVAVATTPTLTLIGDGQATTSATIAFDVDLVDLRITQRTYGFTLGLAPEDDADDCNLCDASGNPPITREGQVSITAAKPLDSTSAGELPPESSIARRDIEAPVFRVVASGDLTIDPSGYSMAFKVAPPADVHQTTNSVPRLTSSYSLLRKDMSGNYAVVPTSPPQPIAQSGDIVVTYDNVPPLPIAVMQNTEAFALGLATDGIFRDASGNDAVVELEGMTEVVTVNPRRPLDARDDALFTIERDAPTITVTANADSITKVGDVYTGSFDVSGSEAIDGITSTASYVLLRVRSGIEPVSLTNAQITLSATVNFRVTDTAAQDGDKYTLGRAANLTDLAGNAPVDPEDDTNVITIGERIDLRTTAELEVPAADTANPIITVTAVGTEGMEAVADDDNNLVYSGEFTVEADKAITGIGHISSYKLLRITDGGEHKQITATLEVSEGETTTSTRSTNATITFTTTLGSAEVLQQTVGFTLGRLAYLLDTDNQAPISYTADRLDARDEAVAAVDAPPRITVTAERSFIDADGTEVLDASSATFPNGIEAVPYAGDGNKYNLSFRVRSSEAIADIMSTSSYILKHLPTADGGDPIDLSPYILASGVQASDAQGAIANREVVIKYTVRFADIAETQRTAGFVLHRADGKLQDNAGNTPLDRNYNPIGEGITEGIIDPGEAAISRRDTTSPELRIRMRGRLDRHRLTGEWTYDISATVSSYPAESMSRSFFDAWYNLLRVIDTQPVSYARARPGDGEGSSIADISPLNTRVRITFDNYNLTELRARKTIGFTVGHTVRRGKIYDLSNNEAFRGGTTQTLVLDQDQPVDARPSTWGYRSRVPPVIEVRATTATAVGNDAYDVSFNVQPKFADSLRIFAMVLGLDSPASYQLLLEYEDGMFEKVQGPHKPRVTRINNFSATVHYEGVSLASQSQTGRLSFALGRVPPVDDDDTNCHLCDTEKNAPVAAPPAGESIDNSNPLNYDYVDDGEPLDANSYAKAAIIQPRIKVAAVGIAQPSLADGDEYTLQFKVEANDAILMASADSYRLIHIPTTGTAAISLSTSNYIDSVNVDGSADSRMSTVSYVVKFDNTEAQTQRTKGFTLGRGGDLGVFNEMNMLIGAGGRLDASPEAVAFRDTISPQIAIAADGKAIRDLHDTTLYSMHFDVTVANDDEVRGLTDPASYQLLQFIKDVAEPMILGDDDIESTTTVTVIDGGVKLSYENVRIDMNSVEMIDAFTLGRAGTSLRDLANNDPVDANPENMADKIDEDGERLDSRDSAFAELIRGILLRVKVFLEGPYR